jgi:hypothetical protein
VDVFKNVNKVWRYSACTTMIPAEHPRCAIGEGERIYLTLHCLINKIYLRSGPQRSRHIHSVENTWIRIEIREMSTILIINTVCDIDVFSVSYIQT